MLLLLAAATILPVGCSNTAPTEETIAPGKGRTEENRPSEPEVVTEPEENASYADPWSLIEQPVSLAAVYTGYTVEGHMLTKDDFQVTGFFADGHTDVWEGWTSDSLGTVLTPGEHQIVIRNGADTQTELTVTCTESRLPRFLIRTEGEKEITSRNEYVRGTLSYYSGEKTLEDIIRELKEAEAAELADPESSPENESADENSSEEGSENGEETDSETGEETDRETGEEGNENENPIFVDESALYDLYEQTVFIKGRGTSTFQFEKKPYLVKFTERTSLFELPAAKKWVFLANYADKTLMRNRIGLEMARSLEMKYVPSTFYAEVYLNDEYMGLYSVGDKIENDPARLSLPYSEDPAQTGYLLDMGKIAGFYFTVNPGLKKVDVVEPSGDDLTDEHKVYIRKIVTDLDTAIREGGDYASLMDVDSFIDWWIVTELSFNSDCVFHRSTYMTVEPGGKLSMGPMWDFDRAFGNFSGDLDRYDTFVTVGANDGSTYVAENWFNYLLQDPSFCSRLQARWKQVGKKLCKESLERIEEDRSLLAVAAEKNFRKYDVMGVCLDYGTSDSVILDTYDKNVDALEQFIQDRYDWLDEAVTTQLPLVLPEPEPETETESEIESQTEEVFAE